MSNRKSGSLGVEAMYEVYDGNAGRKVPDPTKEDESGEFELFVATFPEGVMPAKVGAKMGMTINLGNFESARVDAWVELPCYPEEHEIAMEAAGIYCEDAVRKLVRGTRKGEKLMEKFDQRRKE